VSKRKKNRKSPDDPRSVLLNDLAERLLSPEIVKALEQVQTRETTVRARVELGQEYGEVVVRPKNAERFVSVARKVLLAVLLTVAGWAFGYTKALQATTEVKMETCKSPP
jgi:hypothetical protein